MPKLHKRLIIAFAVFTVFQSVVSNDWKDACLPASMMVNMWMSAKETQLSRPVKIAGFTLVFVLMALACIPIWQDLRKHI